MFFFRWYFPLYSVISVLFLIYLFILYRVKHQVGHGWLVHNLSCDYCIHMFMCIAACTHVHVGFNTPADKLIVEVLHVC